MTRIRLILLLSMSAVTAAAQPPAVQKAEPASAPASQPVLLAVTDNVHVIEPGRAYRCAQLTGPKFRKVIQENRIAVVLNLRGENPKADWYQAEVQACRDAGVELVNIALSASKRPSRENLLRLYRLFRDEKRPILIHCRAGADRTGLASALWRMIVLNEPAERAVGQLSMKYGHFGFAHPHLSGLVREFKAEETWITSQYDPRRDIEKGGSDSGDDDDD